MPRRDRFRRSRIGRKAVALSPFDMQIQLDETNNLLTVDFPSEADLQAFVAKAEKRGPLLRLDDRLEEGRELELALRGSESELRWRVKVRQVFRSGTQLFGTMFDVVSDSSESSAPESDSGEDQAFQDAESSEQLIDAAESEAETQALPVEPAAGSSETEGEEQETGAQPESEAETQALPLDEVLRQAAMERLGQSTGESEGVGEADVGPGEVVPDDGPPAQADDDAEESSPGHDLQAEVRESIGTQGVSAFFEIKKLNPSQKIILAGKASRQQRQLLLRETSPSIHMALLSNPRIELREVQELAKNPQTSAGVLQRLANDKRWGSNYEIQLGIVKNPKTPSPLAIRFVEVLRTPDLRQLAKSQKLRENIRTAALRCYLRRTSKA